MRAAEVKKRSGTSSPPETDKRLARGDRTRQALLDSAFQEIHRQGYRAASLNEILRKANCTKGSLYHHFADKHALGLAAISEHISHYIETNWLLPLADTQDPLSTIREISVSHMDNAVGFDVQLGCPFTNLTLEMSGIDDAFQSVFSAVTHRWQQALIDALKTGQAYGTVRRDADVEAIANLTIATHQGTAVLVKTSRTPAKGIRALRAFTHFLETLRPHDGQEKEAWNE